MTSHKLTREGAVPTRTCKPALVLALTLCVPLSLAACGDGADDDAVSGQGAQTAAADAPEDRSTITLGAAQIAAAGIAIARPVVGGAGTIELPALIEADPEAMQVVSAAIGGRVVALTRNLGQAVGKGQTLAVIESREAAMLNAEVDAAQARLALANANLAREQNLFAQRVSPEQDLLAARTAAREAQIALRLARQQVSAAGGQGGALNRIAIAAPIGGQVIARSVTLGETVAADAELFRVADLSRVSLTFSLLPQDAGRVRAGGAVEVKAAGRAARARIAYVAPALDPATRQVPVIATLDNRSGQWRVGEPVEAWVTLAGSGGSSAIRVPSTAIQTVSGKPTVFVRTASGFRATPVTLGARAGADVIVREGLSGAERIATTNSFTLKAELGKGDVGEGDVGEED
ncbi:efflux RND transporter periplasmic adaptor subunit [Novosphingobium sp. 1949]|uniref:Efflux RND transporter periplasmic adaptor subunit n=1 Tax=Novosphingobium organovorum TaxID=2930092 RepID=A0ABT0BG32_9SPHN|nr:efflux RND transporter periplasmic adaptor subunit [Novosphingobium organovorum]MCJ2183988.1 efflux RND transporter periplasmic adaptor subunit [Novosphingobium organovorum]